MPISFKRFVAISNLGLSFLFSSPKLLNVDTPLAFAATRNMIRNSSIAELLRLFGQFIPLRLFLLSTTISAIFSPL